MLTILVIGRNVRTSVFNCLQSAMASVHALRLGSHVEYVLIDDASDSGKEVTPVMLKFKSSAPSPARVVTFKQRQHYTRAMAYGFSMAKGDSVLFISHDMVITPTYLSTLLAAATLDASFGIIRGTSNYVDGFPQYVITPPVPMRDFDGIVDFSNYVSKSHGLNLEEDKFLTGDSMLVTAAAFKKVGVFDPRYFGYFGDVDYGLRVLRAGLKLICAKGAWLLHEGAAYYKNEAGGEDYGPTHLKRMAVVDEAYLEFRNKWSSQLPATYCGGDKIDHDLLRNGPSPAGGEYQAPITPAESLATIV